MKYILFALLCFWISGSAQVKAQEKCATFTILQQVLQDRPELQLVYQHQLEHRKRQISGTLIPLQTAQKTANVNIRIPVVFHVILTQQQINQLGGESGIVDRAIGQIEVLNADFGRGNSDSVNIPSYFKTVYGNPNISFGLAHRKPDGSSTNGVEITVTTQNGFSATSNYGSDPKFVSSGGSNAWDADAYLNIWIVNVLGGGILGYTIPPSFVSKYGFSKGETGVVVDYGAFGKRKSVNDFFSPSTNDRGRTATHEVGHFFELPHIFGDNANCPGSGDVDDGFADTPPQGNYTYNSDFPNYIPVSPYTDACSPNPPGIMWMNFMDYVDDAYMYMFTKQQSAFMYAQVAPGGAINSLSLHPELFDWPVAVDKDLSIHHLELSPNPSTGIVRVQMNNAAGLQEISVVNLLGQTVYRERITTVHPERYKLDLTHLEKGVYLVRCTFAEAIITKKLLLQ